MKRTVTITRLFALLLATTLQPASAAMLTIDLNEARDTLLQDSPDSCKVVDTNTTECLLPTIEAGGVIVDDFITLSSPNGAYLTSTDDVTELALDATPDVNPLIADFTFDITRALVTKISFTAEEPASLDCTVFQATVQPPDCSSDSNPIEVTSSSFILQLRLGSLENVAYDIEVTYTAVPVPAAAVLFISGLAGLAGFTMRRKQSQPRT